ncbi:unnamed protein product, partial [Acidithrix sp. C25]
VSANDQESFEGAAISHLTKIFLKQAPGSTLERLRIAFQDSKASSNGWINASFKTNQD